MEKMYKCALSSNPIAFVVLPLIINQNQKKLAHYTWDIYQEKHPTMFHGGVFELEIIEIPTIAFLLKTKLKILLSIAELFP